MPDPVRTRTRLIVIQATPFCNVNCRYCYLPNKSSTSSAPNLSALERIVRLREWGKWELVDEVWSVATTRPAWRSDDDDEPDIDWEKAK